MEDFLAHRACETSVCFLDCHLYASGLQRSIELQRSARRGDPPFGEPFRDIPLAMSTAANNIADMVRQVECPVFPRLAHGDLSTDLVQWPAQAICARHQCSVSFEAAGKGMGETGCLDATTGLSARGTGIPAVTAGPIELVLQTFCVPPTSLGRKSLRADSRYPV
jgi:hypothetical protein